METQESRLEDVILKTEDETVQRKKTFKSYEPGFVYVDLKYLSQMADKSSRRYLFVAIDRATRWVFKRIYQDQSQKSSIDFLRPLTLASPIKNLKLLTDDGTQLTDRFTARNKKPTGKHAFNLACTELAIEHRLSPPRHSQTNRMVERFNGRISELIRQTYFFNAAELETTLYIYLKLYNHYIPQRAIDRKTSIQAFKKWQQEKPDLFLKRVYDRTRMDI